MLTANLTEVLLRSAVENTPPPLHETDVDGLADLVEARLGALGPAARGDRRDGFALLLVRLRRSDQRRTLLPSGVAAHLLPVVRRRLSAALNEQDRFAVLGPDELLILLPHVAVDGVARLAMNRLLRALTIRIDDGAAAVELRPAIGCALAPAHGRSVEALTAAVDTACAGATTDEVSMRIARDEDSAEDRRDLLPALRAAIEGNLLAVHYQPQFDLRQRCWSSVEALVRWPRTPFDTPIGPATFVELADAYGMIEPLTRFVLNTALREVGEFGRAGMPLGVAVNLSARIFADAGLPDDVAQALDVWGVAPARLTLEVTETSILRDADAATDVMRRLKNVGARLSIDDFGTGHSSLARLRALPLDELKIDRLFVAAMHHSQADDQIVRSVIDLAHNFELKAVAEGVEDEYTARQLQRLGCDVLQGYFCAEPMSATALRQWWAQRPSYTQWLQ